MSQHDYNIANQGFPNFRTDLNNALGAIATNNSGSTAPTTTFAHQWWLDTSTTPNTLRIRNADNDAWVVVGTVNQTDDTFVFTPAAGSASAPAYSVTGDTNTGIFFPAADTIAFAEGGAEAMRINSSGNVGIGATPTNRFHVADNSASAMIYGLQSGAGDIIALASGASEKFRITNAGDVGIGTSSPNLGGVNKAITLNSAASTNASYELSINGTFIGSMYTNTADSSLRFGGWQNAPMVFLTNSTERARITSGGFFKASNSGSYVSSTGSYHEVVSNANDQTFYVYNSNASFAETIFRPVCARSGTSSYHFLIAYSGWSGSADLEFNLRGDGNAYADGTWNNNGADYAEFFESANGQALTLGATVVLDGTKVREATDQDPASAIIGVVRPKEPSKASMVVGNTAWNKWANKYLTDDFDRYIMEDHDVVEWEEQVLEREAIAAVEAVVDEEGNEVSPAVPAQEAVYKTKQHSYESHNIPAGVTVPADAVRKTNDDKGNKFQHYKLNPAWDKDAEYVNRENRPEWNIIGLLGQVKILKDQPVGDRWIKMRDVSATVEEWMIR
jgi:hypothetical protein